MTRERTTFHKVCHDFLCPSLSLRKPVPIRISFLSSKRPTDVRPIPSRRELSGLLIRARNRSLKEPALPALCQRFASGRRRPAESLPLQARMRQTRPHPVPHGVPFELRETESSCAISRPAGVVRSNASVTETNTKTSAVSSCNRVATGYTRPVAKPESHQCHAFSRNPSAADASSPRPRRSRLSYTLQ